MKKRLFIGLVGCCALLTKAQESTSSFNVLRLAGSARVAALGGDNISIIDEAPAVGLSNPALYANVPDHSLGFTFMTYPAGGSYMGTQFVEAFGERHTAAFALQMMNYGATDETDENGLVLGSFSPKDAVLSAGYSYLMNDRITGGATLKGVYSRYGDFSAFTLAVDLGLNYYDADRDLSVSAAVLNVGRQVKTFHDDVRQHLPFQVQLGVSAGLNNAPVRLSLTMVDVTRWSSKYLYTTEDKVSFGRKVLNHFVVGAEWFPTAQFYVAAGYNARRAYELKQAGSSHAAGLSIGAGLRLSNFKLDASFSKISFSASSLMVNVAYAFPAKKRPAAALENNSLPMSKAVKPLPTQKAEEKSNLSPKSSETTPKTSDEKQPVIE